jgi:LysR family transcriptional regulator of abg operon
VELGTVHAAAQHRFISQPGLSGSIKRLEHQLGITLFDRDGRGMRPNNKGKEFYIHAKQILKQMRLARADLDTGLNTIVVGLGEARPSAFTAYLTNHLHISFPNLGVSFVEGHLDVLAPQMLNGDIDAAVLYGGLDIRNLPLTIRFLARSKWIVFCRPDHPLTNITGHIPIAELKKFGWVKNSTAPIFTPYQPILKGRKTNPLGAARSVTAASEQMAKELILHSDLLGYGPKYSVREELLQKDLVELNLSIEKYFIDIAVARRRDVHSTVLDHVFDLTEDYFQKLQIS